MKIIYPEAQELIELHERIIFIWLEQWEWWSYWFLWWKDKTYIQSILDFIQNDDYYPELEDKITHLMYAVNKNHVFVDGNKRSSIYFSAYFLSLNIFDNDLVEKYIRELEDISVAVADNRIDKETLLEIISSIVNYEEYSEALKLNIFNSINW